MKVKQATPEQIVEFLTGGQAVTPDIVERMRHGTALERQWAAEVEGLRAEVERLRKDNLHWEHQNGLLEAEIERLQENVTDWHDRARSEEELTERLRAEIERLDRESREEIQRLNAHINKLDAEIERLKAIEIKHEEDE